MKKTPKRLRATPLHNGTNTITSLPPAPIDERHARMVRYSVSMSIRLLCFIVIFFVPGWWRLAPAIAAIVLPYIAVVLANAGHDGAAGEVERPGGVELYRPEPEIPGYPAPGTGDSGFRPDFDEARQPSRDSTDEPRVFYAPYAPDAAPRRARPAAAAEAQPPSRDEAQQPKPRGDDVQPRPRE